MVVGVFYRYGNALRFPRARDEPPHSQKTLAVGSHRLRFPAGVYVYFLRQDGVWHHSIGSILLLRWLFGVEDR